jgi:phosphoribosylglycinamide formyltransferase 1
MNARRRRLVVLASGGGTNLQAILDACRADPDAATPINADVVAVVSDRRSAHALERGRGAGAAAVHADPKVSADRGSYDSSLAELVASFGPDYVVLAGWMRLLSSNFLDRFPNRVINLHPAKPGEFPGLHAIERAFDSYLDGERTHSGIMVHLVPDELVDAGPVLATIDVPFEPADTLDLFEARMHRAEHQLLVRTLAELCQGERNDGEPGDPKLEPITNREAFR